jgi:hypothetical protein
MRRLFFVLSASILLLTSCSANASPEPKYDEVDLIQYKACFDYAINGWTSNSWNITELVTDNAIDVCKKYLPVKK